MKHLQFNHAAFLACALFQWVLGVVWYSPLLFGKPWAAMVNFDPKKRRSPMLYGAVSLLANLSISFLLLHEIQWAQINGLKRGAFLGFVLWCGFFAAPLFVANFYESRPYRLFAIQAGYWLIALVGSGAMLARWL
jgi:hypothetical protein